MVSIQLLDSTSPSELSEAYVALLPQLSARAANNLEAMRLNMRRCLNSETCRIFIATNEQHEVVGGLALCWYDHPFGRRGWIEDVVVDQKHRRQGIASLLMQEAQSMAAGLGINCLQLTSNPTRQAAHATYTTLAWSKIDSDLFRFPLNK